jgi:hypothetical protein
MFASQAELATTNNICDGSSGDVATTHVHGCFATSATATSHASAKRSSRAGFCGPWAFPAPAGCHSLEQWAQDGERRWEIVRAKLRQAVPTVAYSPMLTSLETRFRQ